MYTIVRLQSDSKAASGEVAEGLGSLFGGSGFTAARSGHLVGELCADPNVAVHLDRIRALSNTFEALPPSKRGIVSVEVDMALEPEDLPSTRSLWTLSFDPMLLGALARLSIRLTITVYPGDRPQMSTGGPTG